MKYNFLRSLVRHKRGSVVIEAAIWLGLLGVPLVAGIDYGLYAINKQRVNNAVSQASIFGFQARDTINAQLLVNIANAESPMTVTVKCNGNSSCVNTNRSCACITGFASGQPTFTAAASCTATCSNGTTASYFLTVRGEKTYNPILTTRILSLPTSIDRTITVPLQ